MNSTILIPGLLACALLGGSCSLAVADPAQAYQKGLAAWARTLEMFVDDQGRTDFVALAQQPQDLQAFVDAMADYGPSSDPRAFASREQVLAFHINAYNALAMQGVIERGIPDGFNSFFKRASFFKFRAIRVDGKKTNLYDYENKVIRPLGESRVHFALNCMVRDCPRLPRAPFTAINLVEQLEVATREFFASEKYLRLDHNKRRIYVSAILDFYTRDFVSSGKTKDLPAYINAYREEPLPQGYRVRYLEYDWTINQR